MKLFSNLSRTSAIMMKTVGIVCFAMLILGMSVIIFAYPFEKPLAFAIGMATGYAHSILKVVLLERSINQSMDMEKKQAESYAHLHYIGRFVITIAVFAMVILLPGVFGLFGTILGVLSLQIAAHITSIVLKRSQG